MSSVSHSNKAMASIIAVAALIIVALSYYLYSRSSATQINSITSYQGCLAHGYPVEQTFPTTCHVPNGSTFTNPNQSAKP